MSTLSTAITIFLKHFNFVYESPHQWLWSVPSCNQIYYIRKWFMKHIDQTKTTFFCHPQPNNVFYEAVYIRHVGRSSVLLQTETEKSSSCSISRIHQGHPTEYFGKISVKMESGLKNSNFFLSDALDFSNCFGKPLSFSRIFGIDVLTFIISYNFRTVLFVL